MQREVGYHRKYRPLSIDGYVGNELLKERVKGLLSADVRPQVILLEGTSGCGKTTMARLLAKAYLCESDGSNACGDCVVCKGIDKYIATGDFGNVMNLYEYDVGSIGKKDISGILEEMSVPSYLGNWKVYILDEVHLLSVAAQGALLKNLEEPPKDVLIVLCTTDPQKLLNTILSRCQYRLRVEHPKTAEMVELLKEVCKKEGKKYEVKALRVIADRSGNTPRRALTILESIANENDVISYENVVKGLGLIADKYYIEFYKILFESTKVMDYVVFIGTLLSNIDITEFIKGLTEFTIRGIYISNGVNVSEVSKDEINRYKCLFGSKSSKEILKLLGRLVALSNNVSETELLLFGYEEIEGVDSEVSIEEMKADAVDERLEAANKYVERITASEEDIKQLIDEFF